MAKRGKSSGVAGKVLSMSKSWKKAREVTRNEQGLGEWIPVDVGNYNMQLVKAEAGLFGEDHKMHLHFCVIGDNEFAEMIVHHFEGYGNEERDQWMQRLLINLGASDEELDEIEDENDLVGLFQRMVVECVVAKVQVVEKNGYMNTRIKKLVEVDQDDLVDPKDVLGKSDAKSESSDDDDDDGDDDDWKEGDKVKWTGRKGEMTGEIVGFTEDDQAEVKPDGKSRKIKVDLDKLELVEDEDEPKEEEKPAKKSKKPAKAKKSESRFNVGDRVVTEEYGEDFPATIKSISPKGGPKAILVEFDDGDKENVGEGDLKLLEPSDDDGDNGEESEGEEDEIAVGDQVLVPYKDEQKSGEVVEIKDGKVRVKIKSVRKPVWVDEGDVEFDIDD